MREMTPGLTALREAIARLMADIDCVPDWARLTETERRFWVDQAEEVLEEPDTLGFLAAVDTLVGEGFERGASPSVGVLLSEIGKVVPSTAFGSGFQEGLARAIQVLSSEDAAKQQDAYRRGFTDGRAAQRDG